MNLGVGLFFALREIDLARLETQGVECPFGFDHLALRAQGAGVLFRISAEKLVEWRSVDGHVGGYLALSALGGEVSPRRLDR
jgi:hypothetical protein